MDKVSPQSWKLPLAQPLLAEQGGVTRFEECQVGTKFGVMLVTLDFTDLDLLRCQDFSASTEIALNILHKNYCSLLLSTQGEPGELARRIVTYPGHVPAAGYGLISSPSSP
jgi:hypothetical protein